MPTILPRIFLLYKLLNALMLYLVPKKLRTYLPGSWYSYSQQQQQQISKETSSSDPSSSTPVAVPRKMEVDELELERVFQVLDRNGDGRISKKEMNDSLENMGIFIPNHELTDMIERIDANGDGCVDMGEFGELYQTIIVDERGMEEDMREAFNVFDQNGDGFISVDELKSVLASLGLKQGKDCQKMIMKVDVDGDGMVDFVEFKQMMMKGAGAAAACFH